MGEVHENDVDIDFGWGEGLGKSISSIPSIPSADSYRRVDPCLLVFRPRHCRFLLLSTAIGLHRVASGFAAAGRGLGLVFIQLDPSLLAFTRFHAASTGSLLV